jgi:hypothetical protein
VADRVTFTKPAAERIGKVVRLVEAGDRTATPWTVDVRAGSGIGQGTPLRLAEFTGGWQIDTVKTVTLSGSTETYSVRNVCVPLEMHPQSPNTANRSVIFTRVAGEYHSVELETGGQCGSWKEYLVTLTVDGCRGSGARALVRQVGSDGDTDSGSGVGPITDIDLLNGGSDYAQLGRQQPALAVSAASTNVTFTLAYQENTGTCNIPYWTVSGITAGGSTVFWTPQTLAVASLNSAVEVTPAVLALGTAGASVVSGGHYYAESTALPPITHTLTVNIEQASPSNGSGAAFTPTVDTDPTSLTFGRVTGITIDNGGTDYQAWAWNGSVPFGSLDLGLIAGFKSYEAQVLGHEGACLKWFSLTTCATATASP